MRERHGDEQREERGPDRAEDERARRRPRSSWCAVEVVRVGREGGDALHDQEDRDGGERRRGSAMPATRAVPEKTRSPGRCFGARVARPVAAVMAGGPRCVGVRRRGRVLGPPVGRRACTGCARDGDRSVLLDRWRSRRLTFWRRSPRAARSRPSRRRPAGPRRWRRRRRTPSRGAALAASVYSWQTMM